MQSQAMQRMVAARTALVLDHRFWGTLALKLELKEDPTCETAWVDGKALGFNPEYVNTLPATQVKALWAHEVGHCVYGHPWRRDGREFERWNEATDRVLNPTLRDAKFRLPDGALYELDHTHKGKSAEWVFNRLPRKLPQQDQQQDQSGNDSGSGGEQQDQSDDDSGSSGEQQDQAPDKPQPFGGEVRDAPTSSTTDETPPPSEEDWKQAVQQAASLAEGQGQLPGDLARTIEQATQPNINWRSVLRRFMQEAAPTDYTWTQPNPRYMPQELYLPALSNPEVGPIAIAIDTSGSIDRTLLNNFGTEVAAMIEEVQPRRVHILYCDKHVRHTDVFERGEPVELQPHGGGGTSFIPVFAELEKLDEPPVCLIYLTDLLGAFPEHDGGVPTLWVTPKRYARLIVPFGEIVPIEE